MFFKTLNAAGGFSPVQAQVDGDGRLMLAPASVGGGGSGGGGASTVADGADVAEGAKADTAATWYTGSWSIIAQLKLLVAAMVGAGSHAYGYTNGQMTTDQWVFFGTTRTKLFTYTGGLLTAESDWQ